MLSGKSGTSQLNRVSRTRSGGRTHVRFVLYREPVPAPASRDDSHATRPPFFAYTSRPSCPGNPPAAIMPPARQPLRPPRGSSAVPGLLGRLRTALKRTRENLSSGLAELFSRGRKIDAALIDEVEEVLLGADVGVDLTDAIVADLHERLKRRRLADGSAVLGALREHMVQALEPVGLPHSRSRPPHRSRGPSWCWWSA